MVISVVMEITIIIVIVIFLVLIFATGTVTVIVKLLPVVIFICNYECAKGILKI